MEKAVPLSILFPLPGIKIQSWLDFLGCRRVWIISLLQRMAHAFLIEKDHALDALDKGTSLERLKKQRRTMNQYPLRFISCWCNTRSETATPKGKCGVERGPSLTQALNFWTDLLPQWACMSRNSPKVALLVICKWSVRKLTILTDHVLSCLPMAIMETFSQTTASHKPLHMEQGTGARSQIVGLLVQH